MTNFLVNLLSPIFTSLGVSVADLTSYIERLSGYIIAILVALVAMIVVMVAAHKAKKGVRHVIRWQAGIAFVAIVAVLVNVICYGPMYNNVSSILNAKKVELAKETTEQSRETIQKVGEEGMVLLKNKGILPLASDTKKLNVFGWDSTNPLYGGTGSGSSDSSTAISILQSLKDAGYDLMVLVNEDIKNNKELYDIDAVDKNIDFRRVKNLKVYFDNNAISLTTDILHRQPHERSKRIL